MNNLSIHFNYTHILPSIVKNNPTTSTITVVALCALGTVVLSSISTPFIATFISGGALFVTASLVYNILKKAPIESKPEPIVVDLAVRPEVTSLPAASIEAVPGDTINYALLEFDWERNQLKKTVNELEAEIAKGDFSNFNAYIVNAWCISSQKYKRIGLFKWAFPLIEKMIEKRAISDEDCARLHKNLALANVFDASYPTFDGNEGSVNRLALLLASPTFRKMYFSEMERNCEVEDPSPIAEFIHRYEFSLVSLGDAVLKGECFRYFLLGYDKKFIFSNEQIDDILPITIDTKGFTQHWKTLNELLENLHDDVLAERIRDRFINRLSKGNGAKTDFNLTGEVRTLPYKLNQLRKHKYFGINAVTFQIHSTQLTSLLDSVDEGFFRGLTSIVLVGNHRALDAAKIGAALKRHNINRIFYVSQNGVPIDLLPFYPFFESQFEVNFVATGLYTDINISNYDEDYLYQIRLANPGKFRILTKQPLKFDLSRLNPAWKSCYTYTPSFQIHVPGTHEYGFTPKIMPK